MPAVPIATLRAELLSVYEPPLRARATWVKMRQVLAEVEALGIRSTRELTPELVARFARSPASAGRKAITTNGLLSYLRAVCRYAVARRYLAGNPFDACKLTLRAGKPALRRHLARDELGRLLAHLGAARASWAGGRLHALVALVAYTGLRRGEALRLEVADVDLAGGFLRVVARHRLKTEGSEAIVPIPPPCGAILADWLPRTGAAWAFPGARRRGPWTGGIAGTKPLDRLKAEGVAAGVGPVTFQMLRHSLATHARSYYGLSALQIQEILRHARPETQAHYQHADLANLRAAVAAIDFEPRAAG